MSNPIKNFYSFLESLNFLTQTSFQQNAQKNIGVLPEELIIKIFSHLDFDGWNSLSLTNKFFYHLSRTSLCTREKIKFRDSLREEPLETRLQIAKNVSMHFKIKTLDLSGSTITDKQLQQALVECPNVERLIVSSCKNLTDAAFASLPPNLHTLEASGCNQLTDKAFASLPPNLHTLDAMACDQLTDAAFASLPPNLQTLKVMACNLLTDKAFTSLPIKLHTLEVWGCSQLTDAAFVSLPSNLQVFICNCEQVTDKIIPLLPKSLKTLELNCCELTGKTFDELPQELNILRLGGCFNLIEECVPLLPRSLKEFSLIDCNLTGEYFNQLPNLDKLDLSYCRPLEEEALTNLPQSLRDLNLSGTHIEGKNFNKLPEGLESLCLAHCKNLDTTAFYCLPSNLQVLDASFISYLQIHYLIKLPPNLRQLYLDGCPLTDSLIGWKNLGDAPDFPIRSYLSSESHLKWPKFFHLQYLKYYTHQTSEFSYDEQSNSNTEFRYTQIIKFPDCLPRNLEILSLGRCNLYGTFFSQLPKKLYALYLNNCSRLKNSALTSLPFRLQILDLSECSQLTDDVVLKLKKYSELKKLILPSSTQLTTRLSIMNFKISKKIKKIKSHGIINS